MNEIFNIPIKEQVETNLSDNSSVCQYRAKSKNLARNSRRNLLIENGKEKNKDAQCSIDHDSLGQSSHSFSSNDLDCPVRDSREGD